MKKIFLALIFTMFGAFFGMSAYADSPEFVQQEYQILMRQPIKEEVDRQSTSEAARYFDNCLPAARSGQSIYPDTYGGCYKDGGNFVIQVTTSDLSEYLFLQEEFPCVVFEQVKYSENYLQGLVDEYLMTYDPETETVYCAGVDVHNNCVFIRVDEETLSHKTNDPDSPIRFELGHPIIPHSLYPENNAESDEDSPAVNKSSIETINEEDIYNTINSFTKSNQAVTNVKGGQTLENRGPFGNKSKCKFTAGIGCTTSDGKKGLVACGHDMAKNDLIALDGGTLIGYVSLVQYTNGFGDYCIITLADNVTADGATYCQSNVVRQNHNVHNPMVGDKLFRYSQLNKFATFTVEYTNITIPQFVDGQLIYTSGMAEAKLTSGDVVTYGDSGVGVYHNSRDDDFSSFLEFSGIVSTGDDYNGTFYFTMPKYIYNCTIVCV